RLGLLPVHLRHGARARVRRDARHRAALLDVHRGVRLARDLRPRPRQPAQRRVAEHLREANVLQLFHDPKIDFMGKRRMWVAVSLSLVAISIAIVFSRGIKRGIEFEGGAEVQLQYASAPDVATVRELLAKAGYQGSVVTTIGKPEEHEVYVRVPLVAGAK